MESPYAAPDLAILDTADRIGRTAYLWLRQHAVSGLVGHSLAGHSLAGHSMSNPINGMNGNRRAHLLAAGFISKLCDSLRLTTQHGLLAAYAYALLDDSDSNSLAIAAILLDAVTAPQTAVVFEEGRSMAAEMLHQLDDSGYRQTSADGDEWVVSHFTC